jgi:uncharacterized protein (TIGR03435 family)
MSFIVLAVAKATVILCVALAAARVTARARAAIRHVVLAVTFAALLILPVAMRLLPDVLVPVPLPSAATMVQTMLPGLSDAANQPLPMLAAPPRSTGAPLPAIVSGVSVETTVMAFWVIGVCLAVAPLASGAIELRRIRRQATSFTRGEVLLKELASELGVSRLVPVAIHPDISGPMTCGVQRPVVMFPPDARHWSDGDLRCAMRHELEHVRRADCLIDSVARCTCAVYWFHPLVWIAWRRLRLEAERACDDAVLGAADAIDYADQLVALAARVSTRRVPLMAMAGKRDLSRRVAALLDRRQRRGQAGRARTAGLLAAGIAVVGAIAPLSASWQSAGASAPAFEVASIKENTSGDPFGGGDRQLTWLYPGGRYTARNTTLRELILLAYRWEITRSQLAGLEPWMNQRRFDIEARAADDVVAPGALDVPRAQLMDRMLQTLLADRFKLRVRREQRTGDLHVLSIAPGGLTMTPAKDVSCEARTNQGGLSIKDDPGAACHMFRRIGRTGFEGVAVDTLDIAMALRTYLGQPVEDRARLSSLYTVTARWKPETPSRGNGPGPFGNEPQADENDPDIYTALREQLGLKLSIERAPIEMLVVESAEPPTSN